MRRAALASNLSCAIDCQLKLQSTLDQRMAVQLNTQCGKSALFKRSFSFLARETFLKPSMRSSNEC